LTIVFYVSSHGFGHASRDIAVIGALARRRPEARIVVRTGVPAWFFEPPAGAVEIQTCETDTGVVQTDSLRLDEAETARRAASFYAGFEARAAAEATVLRGLAADVVVADVPPLGVAAADLANVPCLIVANFTWDWIYDAYLEFERLAPGVIEKIRGAYSTATRALRLPLHGGFESIGHVTRDIPLVARVSRRGRDTTRRLIGLGQETVAVLASFGRYGLELPYDEISRSNQLALIVTDHESGKDSSLEGSQLVCLPRAVLLDRRLAYEDLVAAADVVVSKPGYGIVSECIANDTALLYTSRGPFAEHDVLVQAMPKLLRCRHIAQEDLLAGRWTSHVHALLRQPAPAARPPYNGADVAADEILEVAERESARHSA
jgi:L-arabinokinase